MSEGKFRLATRDDVERIEAKLDRLLAVQGGDGQTPITPPPKPKDHGPHALDRKEAMELLRISCGKTFLATVRRLGIPRIKMNKRKYLYPKADLLAVLDENRVGVSRSRFARSRRQLL